MARLIVFSDYLKGGTDRNHVLESLEYIATRDGVELNANQLASFSFNGYDANAKSIPISKKQEQLIQQLTTTYPDLKELDIYEVMNIEPNLYNASTFISEAFENLEELSFSNERYMKYISERPGVQIREESNHGLFDQSGNADIKSYMQSLKEHNGNVWRDIISLRREDAVDLEYDNQEAWALLLKSKMHEKAKLMGIPEQNFKWVAAFHDESYHPHVHVMYWDESASAGFQNAEDIESFKSKLANEIFKNEMWLNKELKYENRIELEETYKDQLDTIIKDGLKSVQPELFKSLYKDLTDLSFKISDTGSRSYGYQEISTKESVDNIVSRLLNLDAMHPLLIEYLETQKELVSFYRKDTEEYMNQYLNKLVHPEKNDRKVFHNAVLKASYEIKDYREQMSYIIGNEFKGLNTKISNNELPSVTKKQEEPLIKAILKTKLLQDKEAETIVSEISYLVPNEEKALELLLECKDSPNLTKNDRKLLNKAFNETIDTSYNWKEHEQTSYSNGIHSARKLFQNFFTALAGDTKQQAETNRQLQAMRNEDRYLIRKSKIRNQR